MPLSTLKNVVLVFR